MRRLLTYLTVASLALLVGGLLMWLANNNQESAQIRDSVKANCRSSNDTKKIIRTILIDSIKASPPARRRVGHAFLVREERLLRPTPCD